MYKSLSNHLRKVLFLIYRSSIREALALHRRGEARWDGLALRELCNRLEVSWEAREIHTWDVDLPAAEKDAAFVEQTLEDTEAAVLRIFERLPEVDVVDVKVIAPISGDLLAFGSVARATLRTADARVRSVRMRLGALGIKYCSDIGGYDDREMTDLTLRLRRRVS